MYVDRMKNGEEDQRKKGPPCTRTFGLDFKAERFNHIRNVVSIAKEGGEPTKNKLGELLGVGEKRKREAQ